MGLAREILPLILVFGLLGLAVWKLGHGRRIAPRWFSGPSRGRMLEPLDRLALTPEHALHLVRLRGRELMLATHPRGCLLLTETRAEVPEIEIGKSAGA